VHLVRPSHERAAPVNDIDPKLRNEAGCLSLLVAAFLFLAAVWLVFGMRGGR